MLQSENPPYDFCPVTRGHSIHSFMLAPYFSLHDSLRDTLP